MDLQPRRSPSGVGARRLLVFVLPLFLLRYPSTVSIPLCPFLMLVSYLSPVSRTLFFATILLPCTSSLPLLSARSSDFDCLLSIIFLLLSSPWSLGPSSAVFIAYCSSSSARLRFCSSSSLLPAFLFPSKSLRPWASSLCSLQLVSNLDWHLCLPIICFSQE